MSLPKLLAWWVVLFCTAVCAHATPLALAPANHTTALQWTAEEAAYLASQPTVRMCVDPDWMPFEQINKQGQHEGIAADLVQLVGERVGLRIALYPTSTWEESLAASKTKRCQVMSFLNQTPERSRWLAFTVPIFSDQNIIITREDHPYIGDAKNLTQKTIALPRGTMVEERIRRDYPRLRLLLTQSEEESVRLVSDRKVDMTVRSLIVGAHAIKKEGLFNLKVAGQMPDEYTNQLRIGVLKEETLLRSILDKGAQTITAQEREAITSKYVTIHVRRGVDYTLVWQAVGAGLLVVLVVLYWNRKLRRLNSELKRLSVTDRLTGLFNRVKLDEEFEAELEQARQFGRPFSIILADIDHFKEVNDTHGHQIGDQVLIEFSTLLTTYTRKTDITGRWGGEEFMVICPQTDALGVHALAQDLRESIASYRFSVVGHKTASFGVTTYRAGDHVKDMVARADKALYAAKNRGRNCVEVAV